MEITVCSICIINYMKHIRPLIHNHVPTNTCDGMIGSVLALKIFFLSIFSSKVNYKLWYKVLILRRFTLGNFRTVIHNQLTWKKMIKGIIELNLILPVRISITHLAPLNEVHQIYILSSWIFEFSFLNILEKASFSFFPSLL